MGQEHFRVHRVKLGEAVCSTLQSVKAEPSDRRWKVTSGFHTTGREAPPLLSTHAHTHTPDVREEKKGKFYTL